MSGRLKGHWYRLVALKDGDQIAEQEGTPVHLCQRYYDEEGNHLLSAARINADNVPPQAIRSLSKALELAELAPTIVVGPNCSLLKLEAMSDVESRRMDDELERARRERDEAVAALNKGGGQ